MIKKIVIRDVASYDHEGVTFDNLAKVNIIYGGNGTGKTTFSRVLEANESLKAKYPGCRVVWDGKPMQVLVYNQDFRRRNLSEEIPGVFSIGEPLITSLAKWSDEGSHGAMDEVFAGDRKTINDKYLHVFEMLFKKLGHEAHYNMMMREE